MNVTYKLFEVGVLPSLSQHQNVVARVRWGIVYEDNGISSLAGGESILDTSSITDFTPIDQISREQILEWAFAVHGGESFLQELLTYHTQQIEYQRAQVGVVSDTTHFALDPLPSFSQSSGSGDTGMAPIFPTPATGGISVSVFQ